MLRLLAAAAVLFVCCAPAQAANYYGSIAFSPATGATGFATKRSTWAKAQGWAMYYCRGEANDCRIAVNFVNACGAVARGENGGWGSDWNTTAISAQNDAIDKCSVNDSGCHVVKWACSM